MPEGDREWLRVWVEHQGADLSPQQKERALDVAESAFRGWTGVGDASQIGVDSVRKQDGIEPPRR